MKCADNTCNEEATHTVTLSIPAEGVPIDLHRPIKMYLGIELCHDHAKAFGKGFDWGINSALKEAIDESLASTSSTKADYDRTFATVVKLNDPGYLQFLEFQRKRGKPV